MNNPISLDALRQISRQMLVIYQGMLRAQALGVESQAMLRRADDLLRQAGLAYLTGAAPAPAIADNDAPAGADAYARIQRSYAGLLEALYALGVELGRAGDWAAAEPVFTVLMDLDPSIRDTAAWHERVVAFGEVQQVLATGDPLVAKERLQAWLKRHPEDRKTVEAVASQQRLHLSSLFDWVEIPAGEFLYGDQKTRIHLDAFRIARTPVTNAQYNVFVQFADAGSPSHWAGGRIPAGKEDHPVVNVSWEDAQAFCAWAGLRLPKEQEWEKAARGTDGRAYPWGNQAPSADLCNFNNVVGNTTPVGRYPQGASPYGLLDMAGNVWEWCENPHESGGRVKHGGSYANDASGVGCAFRSGNLPNYRYALYGFRVVCP